MTLDRIPLVRGVSWVVLTWALCAPSPALGLDIERVEDHVHRARAAYSAEAYEDALAILLAVDDEVRSAGDHHLFRWAMARCYDKLARWEEALDAYRRFERVAPDGASRRRGRDAIEDLTRRAFGHALITCPPRDGIWVGLSADGPFSVCPHRFALLTAGPRTVHLRRGDEAWRVELEVLAGETVRLDIPPRAHAATAPAARPADDAVRVEARRWTVPRWDTTLGGGLSTILGESPGWTFEPGGSLSAGSGLEWSLPGAFDAALAALYHHQRHRFVKDGGPAYEIRLHSIEVGAFLGWRIASPHALDPRVIVGLGGEFPIRSSLKRPDVSDEVDRFDLGLGVMHLTATGGLGVALWSSEGSELRLGCRVSGSLTRPSNGEARWLRAAIVSSYVFGGSSSQ